MSTRAGQAEVIGAAEFLDLIHGSDVPVHFQVGGLTWKNRPQTFRQAEATLRWRNAEGDDIGFVVNGGGTTATSITRVNAVWIDWDCGRDRAGLYYDLDVVATRRDEFVRSKLTPFQPKPSIVVETRNGLHAYWLTAPGTMVAEFRLVQAALAAHFGSDPSVGRPCNVMRLPGFDWVKARTGLPRYPVRVVSAPAGRYEASAILAGLGDVPAPVRHVSVNGDATIRHHNRCSGTHTTAPIVVPDRHAGDAPVVVPSMAAAIEYLKSLDLARHLDIHEARSDGIQHVRCPFHQDDTPSATLAWDAASGHWLFCCHAGTCGVAGTIIDVEMRATGVRDPGTAIASLMRRYDVRVESEWVRHHRQVLADNRAVLADAATLQRLYPSLHRWIGRLLPDLRAKLNLGERLIGSERMQHAGSPIFFASLREMERIRLSADDRAGGIGRQGRYIDRYAILGIIRKLADADLPPLVLDEARKHRGPREHRVQFYQFPAYTADVLGRADERASALIAAGARTCGVSRQLVRDLFGQEVADEVYPMAAGRALAAGDHLAGLVTDIVAAQVGADGYSTTRRILAAMSSSTGPGGLTERRLTRLLPGVLQRLGLMTLTSTKQLKSELKIGGRGYPKVIVVGARVA